MGRIDLKKRIKGRPFILDGAMGTQLIMRGVETGGCNEYLNITSSDIICNIHESYLQAGSDAVLTNTFGANRFGLSRHGFSDMVGEINIAAAQISRRAAEDKKYVLGDIGPSGDFLQPLGTLTPHQLEEAFAEQAEGLLAGDVDGFIIETMTDIEEVKVAIRAVESVCDLPIFVSMAFDKAGEQFRTMMGLDVKSAVSVTASKQVAAVGFNCGKVAIEDYISLAEEFVRRAKAVNPDVEILAEPNAGLPELIDGKAVYNLAVDKFASAIEKIHSAGVNILGGCCGTGPEYIEAVAAKLRR